MSLVNVIPPFDKEALTKYEGFVAGNKTLSGLQSEVAAISDVRVGYNTFYMADSTTGNGWAYAIIYSNVVASGYHTIILYCADRIIVSRTGNGGSSWTNLTYTSSEYEPANSDYQLLTTSASTKLTVAKAGRVFAFGGNNGTAINFTNTYFTTERGIDVPSNKLVIIPVATGDKIWYSGGPYSWAYYAPM